MLTGRSQQEEAGFTLGPKAFGGNACTNSSVRTVTIVAVSRPRCGARLDAVTCFGDYTA